MAKEVATVADVDAAPEQVWDLLARFREYEHWHPRIERLTLDTRWSTRLRFRVRRDGRRSRRLGGQLLEFSRPHRIKWMGGHPIPGLVSVTYTVQCARLGSGRTQLQQTVKVGGLFQSRAARAAEQVVSDIGTAVGVATEAGLARETEPAA